MKTKLCQFLKFEQDPRRWPLIVICAATGLVAIYGWVFSTLPWTADPSAWGSFGDYIGGLLNPLVSTLTLIIAIKVWYQQREELKATKEALEAQAETASANRREQRFFDLMQVYQQMLETFQETATGQSLHGKPALDLWLTNQKPLGALINEIDGKRNTPTQRRFAAKQHWKNPSIGNKLSHYFRVIFRILEDAESLLQEDRYRFIRLFRAQLSHTELALLGLNLLASEEGQKMIQSSSKYGLLKHLPKCDLRDLLEEQLPPEVFGRTFALSSRVAGNKWEF